MPFQTTVDMSIFTISLMNIDLGIIRKVNYCAVPNRVHALSVRSLHVDYWVGQGEPLESSSYLPLGHLLHF